MKRLWTNSLVAKFFLSYLAVVLLLFAGFYLYSSTILRDHQIATLSGRMEQEAHLLGRVLPFDIEGADLDSLCRDLAQRADLARYRNRFRWTSARRLRRIFDRPWKTIQADLR